MATCSISVPQYHINNFSILHHVENYPNLNKICFVPKFIAQPANFSSRTSPYSNRVVSRLRVGCVLLPLGLGSGKGFILGQNLGGKVEKMKKRMVLVKFNQGFGFGGGGGGGKDDGSTARVLGNIVLAVSLTYLSITGQLGWILDAIVSVWLIAFLLPIVGFGAFLWWAGRDMVQDSCPNCGNDFQVFKSTLNDDLQLCPYCSQPFSVVGNKFVRDPVKFSNQSTTFGEAFSEFSSWSKKGKESSAAVVDVEAEVKDVD